MWCLTVALLLAAQRSRMEGIMADGDFQGSYTTTITNTGAVTLLSAEWRVRWLLTAEHEKLVRLYFPPM